MTLFDLIVEILVVCGGFRQQFVVVNIEGGLDMVVSYVEVLML